EVSPSPVPGPSMPSGADAPKGFKRKTHRFQTDPLPGGENHMGRTQVLAVAILGAWIASTLCMWFAATRSFATVERVMKGGQPEFVEITKPLGEASTRMVVRHMASEINRTLFRGYGALQLLFGAILFLLVLRQSPRHTLDISLVATMLLLSVVLTLVITPMVT